MTAADVNLFLARPVL